MRSLTFSSFGYDTGQISGFLEMPDFLQRFGQQHADGTYYFSNVRSGLIVAMLSIGTLIGALVAGPVADIIGRRSSISWWCVILSVGFIVQISSDQHWYQIMMGVSATVIKGSTKHINNNAALGLRLGCRRPESIGPNVSR